MNMVILEHSSTTYFLEKKVYFLSNDPIFMKLCALERGDLGASNDGTAIFFGPSEVTITSFEVKKLFFFENFKKKFQKF